MCSYQLLVDYSLCIIGLVLIIEMESGTTSGSASDSSFRSTFVGNSSGSSRSRERFSTPLNGSNCAIWA